MSQNRKAPAYQEYAANILAQFTFRTMSLLDRGLLYTMRMECWVNRQLPSNPTHLSKLLGLNESEVISSLPIVMSFFKIDGDFIVCPELEDYRANLEAIRQKQSKAGKDAVSKINSKRKSKRADSSPDSSPDGIADGSLIQSNSKQYNQIQSIEKEVIKDPFIEEMEEYEATEGRNDKKRFMRI